MLRDDFTREWTRLCDGFGEPVPNAIRMEALFTRFGQRGLPVVRELVSALLLDARMPNGERIAKAFADVVSRRQEFDSASMKAQTPTFEHLATSAYSAFRCGIVCEMLDRGLTPAQVADRLEAAMPRFPEITALEVATLRKASLSPDPWAAAHSATVGMRFTNRREPDDMVWHNGERVRRDSLDGQQP